MSTPVRRATLFAALVLCPALSASAQTHATRRGTSLENTVDPGIKPGDDFYAYANGAWLKANDIPAGKERWGIRNEIEDATRLQLARLLDDAANAPRGSLARKVADFRTALSNESAIDARGLAPLKPSLDSIDRIQDKLALTKQLGRGMRADVDPLNWGVYQSATPLGLSVEPSIHAEKTYVPFLLQGGLGLPDRENYLGNEPAMVALRNRYRAYVVKLLTLAKYDHAEQRADAVLALETAMAQTQATREASAVDRNADTVWTRAEFARTAPGMDWSVYFAAAGLAKQGTFGAWQPTALRGIASLVASQPIDAWKDYLRVRALDMYADALPADIAHEAWAIHGISATRAQRATDLTHLAMSDAIGRLYADRYFSASQKARVQKIAANVKEAFVHRLEALTWMSPTMKAVTLQKARNLYIGIGYPDHWPDLSDITVDPADAFGNLQHVERRSYHHALALLGKPVDRTEFLSPPQRVNAILIFQLNIYDFSAALLQGTKYDSTASDAATYGAIGAIIGHDVVHYVDLLGSDYEVDGRLRHWWSADDMSRFQAVVDPLATQFSTYKPLPDVAINGKLTLSENVADIGGLAAAFDAYRKSLGSKAADKELVRKYDREFFIAFAQSWRGKLSESAMRAQAATNDHAPEIYRVSTVRNFDAWYDAFDVRPGERLYLDPSARVRIW